MLTLATVLIGLTLISVWLVGSAISKDIARQTEVLEAIDEKLGEGRDLIATLENLQEHTQWLRHRFHVPSEEELSARAQEDRDDDEAWRHIWSRKPNPENPS